MHKKLKAFFVSPFLHVALPFGVLGYIRLSTHHWPTLEQWILGLTLLATQTGRIVRAFDSERVETVEESPPSEPSSSEP